MKKGIYTFYKERLIEIGGSNQCLYLDDVSCKSMYDLGRIFEGRDDKLTEFADFLWTDGRKSLTVISRSEKDDILRNLEQGTKAALAGTLSASGDAETAKNKKTAEEKFTLEGEVNKIKRIAREADEVERETGRYETYLGYPFVFGCINQGSSKTLIKAPLILFPITVNVKNDASVEIKHNPNEKIQINPALIHTYSQFKKLRFDQTQFEYDKLAGKFGSVSDVISYLSRSRIRIGCQPSKNVFGYSKFKEPEWRLGLSVRFAAVIGRFNPSNSIYNDYLLLEKKKIYNDALDDLFKNGKNDKKTKAKKKANEISSPSYTVNMLDCARSEIIKKVDEKKSTVIYGPPGTGKSQTVINLITDAICKGKRVLVVSHKKSALDAVYHRLGSLNDCAMYISGEAKERALFYDRCIDTHQNNARIGFKTTSGLALEYNELEKRIEDDTQRLSIIHSLLNTVRPFGLSLREMYSSSYKLKSGSQEYSLYQRMLEYSLLMKLSYGEMEGALKAIRENNLAQTYFRYMQTKEKNPLINCILTDASLNTLSEVKGKLESIIKSKKELFDTARYPYYKQVLAYYPMLKRGEKIDHIVKIYCKLEKKNRLFRGRYRRRLKATFIETFNAIESYIKDFNYIYRVLNNDGYLTFIDNVLIGNLSYVKMLYDAIGKYMDDVDFHSLPIYLNENNECILSFAYKESKNYSSYLGVIDSLLKLRIYHEILETERSCGADLELIGDFDEITARIRKLKDEELALSRKLCTAQHVNQYLTLYENAKNNKDYLYEISKKHNHIPIKSAMECYGELLLTLFPCWLLSPDNVSSLLPLAKNMFDIVIFDEASEMHIENAIPSIFRGKTIVVAGDKCQLRPTAAFLKRYYVGAPRVKDKYNPISALADNSLYDLAAARHPIINLTYYFGSHSRELIDFSDGAFYNSQLCIAPNVSKKPIDPPIKTYKVDGVFKGGKNVEEARLTAEILRDILQSRKNNESIGIITLNEAQQFCIADIIESEAARDEEFRLLLSDERNRIDDGLYSGLFIKSADNVQGDERDVIILSVGYSKNERGELSLPLSAEHEGDVNVLNVALTRARSKAIIITSLNSEDIVCDGKQEYTLLLKKYLAYAEAVAVSDKKTASSIIESLCKKDECISMSITDITPIGTAIKKMLEDEGYKVDLSLGSAKSRISLAIYDQKTRGYILGIELDSDALPPSVPHLERDIYKRDFLEAHGWNIKRVWCRDWWHDPNGVISDIVKTVEKIKKNA